MAFEPNPSAEGQHDYSVMTLVAARRGTPHSFYFRLSGRVRSSYATIPSPRGIIPSLRFCGSSEDTDPTSGISVLSRKQPTPRCELLFHFTREE